MEFIVETGEGLSNATSYITIEEADSYITTFAPNNDSWGELSIEDKERYLIRSTRYVDNMLKWASALKNSTQSLNWPRQDFYDSNGRLISSKSIPMEIKDATALAASEESSGIDINEKARYLRSEKFGDTNDVYAIPFIDGGSDALRSLANGLSYLGYGRSTTSFVTIWRS